VIFIYEKSAKVPGSHLKALRDAGIVPIQVESLEQCKLMDPDLQQFPANKAFLAALAAICQDKDYAHKSQERFCNELLAALSTAEKGQTENG
jgi:hypothetical protein